MRRGEEARERKKIKNVSDKKSRKMNGKRMMNGRGLVGRKERGVKERGGRSGRYRDSGRDTETVREIEHPKSE